MKTYHGSCHCGVVRFEAELDLTAVGQCNCSICTKKGQLSIRVADEGFRLISGKDDLRLYQFNTEEAEHYFCKHCGIHAFNRPRADPSLYNVNVRCLDDFDLAAGKPKIRKFDGKNWEEAIKKAKFA